MKFQLLMQHSRKSFCSFLLMGLATLLVIPLTSMASFEISNKPVNPACLNMINGSEADLPFIYELNMDRCQGSNAAFAGSKGTTHFIIGKNPATQCHYGYKLIGQAKNGIYVISTMKYCMDASGRFSDLILAKLEKKNRYVFDSKTNHFQKKPYTALNFVADLGGADRFSGRYYDLSVIGNKLIGKRRPIDSTPTNSVAQSRQRFVIDISNL